jgi:hypothetical protein
MDQVIGVREVFVVTISDAESTMIVSIHETYEGAYNSWNKERIDIINGLEKVVGALQRKEHYNWQKDEMYTRMFKNLSCEDPVKIDNHPHETPEILTYTLEK